MEAKAERAEAKTEAERAKAEAKEELAKAEAKREVAEAKRAKAEEEHGRGSDEYKEADAEVKRLTAVITTQDNIITALANATLLAAPGAPAVLFLIVVLFHCAVPPASGAFGCMPFMQMDQFFIFGGLRLVHGILTLIYLFSFLFVRGLVPSPILCLMTFFSGSCPGRVFFVFFCAPFSCS